MAVQVVRAAQNTYDATQTGGTRDNLGLEAGQDISAFFDAIDAQEAEFLNSLSKGRAGNQPKEYTLAHQVRPRGSQVGTAGALAAVTTIPLPTSHGVRFQQGHVLQVTRASDNAYEIMWVNADPLDSSLSVKRAQAGTTALAFVAGDEIKVIGIAMPQLSNYPLSPVARGRVFWNCFQKFSGHLEFSSEARVTGSVEYPDGDQLDRDMLDLGKNMKLDLNQTFINGRRQLGSPQPDDPVPGMTGGLLQFAELSGNVYNVGGAATKLSIEAVEEALIDLDTKFASKRGTRLLMSIRTKQIFNRLLHPSKYSFGADSNGADLRWEWVQTEVGRYEFNHMRDIPNGVIIVYNPREMGYGPYQGLDWKEKDVPTKGDWVWRGVSGTFTFRPGNIPTYAVIRNFDINLASYPKFGSAAA